MTPRDIQRFWSFVIRQKGCWPWMGGINSTGRGIFWLNNETPKAHRISWIVHHGPIPKGKLVLHRCDNGRCVNPEHLFLGTHRDNTQDMIKKGRFVGNRKLKWWQIERIINQYSFRKVTYDHIARRLGFHSDTIGRIIRQHKKTCV